MTDYNKKIHKILDSEYVDAILYTINKLCPHKRQPKYSNIYYLYHIILVLTQLQKWESLNLLFTCTSKYHFKTIQDKHLEWSKLNIYEEAYRYLLDKYKHFNLKKSSNLILFIDTTHIYNKGGVENIGYGYNPKKKETKISAICDENKNIYSSIISSVNHKSPSKTTLKDDAHLVEENLENLLEMDFKYKKIKLVGDKGYARTKQDKKYIQDNFNVQLNYPHRKNQKEKTPNSVKKLLKNRYVIENVFARIKRFDRICIRKDRLTTTFKGFMYMAIILQFRK